MQVFFNKPKGKYTKFQKQNVDKLTLVCSINDINIKLMLDNLKVFI